MGTSSSSKGPKGGVSFDPPWLDTAIAALGDAPTPLFVTPHDTLALATTNRFTAARRNLSAYMRNGESASLRKAIGHYIRQGLGGTTRAAGRMRYVAAVGARTFSLFAGSQSAEQIQFKTKLGTLLSSSHTTDDVISTIVAFVLPTSGSVDEETCRDSMAEALSDLLSERSDMDIANLSEEDSWALLEHFVGKAIIRQLILDIGQILESDAIDVTTKIQRLEEMDQFVQATVSESFHKIRSHNANISQGDLTKIVNDVLEITFQVFGQDDE